MFGKRMRVYISDGMRRDWRWLWLRKRVNWVPLGEDEILSVSFDSGLNEPAKMTVVASDEALARWTG